MGEAKIEGMDENRHTSVRWRFQFTIARLLACTTLAALAAWTATVDLPFTLTVSALGERNILPFVLVSLLLAAAVGVLTKGKPGAIDGVRIGCGVLIAAAAIMSVCLTLRELIHWLALQL
jgi:hypothetical protein